MTTPNPTTKVRQHITISGWVDGSGYSYTQDYDDQIIEIDAATLHTEPDWDWWEVGKMPRGEDTEITIGYYALDADADAEPLASWSKWESEIAADGALTEDVEDED